MCYYGRHRCRVCHHEHLVWSSHCEKARGDEPCGVKTVVNDGYDLGDLSCGNCLKGQYPYDPTREADPTEIDQSDEVRSGMYHLLPKPPSSTSAKLGVTDSLKLLTKFCENTADIPSKGAMLAPMEAVEEVSKEERRELEWAVNYVKERRDHEWPKPGETREEWGKAQSKIRITTEEVLDREWKGFMECLRRMGKQSQPQKGAKIAIPRPQKAPWE